MSRLDPISILWDNYLEMNPGIYKIFKSLSQREREVDPKANIINDHIALRTLNIPGMDMYALADIFIPYGYKTIKDNYLFPQKKLILLILKKGYFR